MTIERAASRLVAELGHHLDRGEGYRFGESTVVSRHVHLVSSLRPGEVDVVADADAGRVFYHRRTEGQILHLDVFHELAEVSHQDLARRLAAAASRHGGDTRFGDGAAGNRAASPCLSVRRAVDYIDLQTATGGGRVTGGLGHGRGATLRRAHLTHVHVAMLATRRDLPIVPHLIMAAEEEILRQGYQIRRLERLNHLHGQGAPMDLSKYASLSDSLLRESGHDWSLSSGQRAFSNPSYAKGVLDLVDEFGGLEELREILAAMADRQTWTGLHRKLRGRVPLNQILSRLEGEGLVESEHGFYALTQDGQALADYVARHRREIELRFKLSLRKLPFCAAPGRKGGRPAAVTRPASRGSISYRTVTAAPSGRWIADLAVPETVVRAAVRCRVEGMDGLSLGRSDLQVHGRRGLGPLDLCLLVDASASMAGLRMRAAKYLAQHLLLSTRDRVAVVTFQEREAGISVPFTRSFDSVQDGLSRIRPLGLTPMAEGLLQAAGYVRRERRRDPLLLLITDGIPTVPRWSMNPVSDALAAARALTKDKIRFSCIGLEPNLEFLKDLAAAARGTLHVVQELDQTMLSEIAHSERLRVRL